MATKRPIKRIESSESEKARKAAVDRRLWDEEKLVPGRREQALTYKAAVYQEAKKRLMMKAAVEYSWDEMEKAFPPLTEREKELARLEKSAAAGEEEAVVSESEKAVPEEPMVEIRRIGNLVLPLEWPEIPETAPYKAEVQWVYSNLVAIGSGKRLNLSRAFSPPPSRGAVGMAKHYMGCTRDFYDKIAKPVLGGVVDESESANVRREKTRIEDIRRILDDLREAKA